MRHFIFMCLLLLSISSVFAATNKVTLYDCHPDSVTLIPSIVPGAVWDERDCTMYNNTSIMSAKECVSRVREYNQKTLKLLQSGKCEKSGYRITGTSGNIKCSVDYDTKSITGYYTSGNSDYSSDSCIKNLINEIKIQYPNIKYN